MCDRPDDGNVRVTGSCNQAVDDVRRTDDLALRWCSAELFEVGVVRRRCRNLFFGCLLFDCREESNPGIVLDGPVFFAANPGRTKIPLPTIAPILIVIVAYNPRSRSRSFTMV